ncbi:MAG: alpha-mannosidase [Maribacter sp.]|nr:MAG: alpha-mannosidase [Maribacter sp.]
MKTKYRNLFFTLIFLLFNSCNEERGTVSENKDKVFKPISYVSPFLGTAPLTDPQFIGYVPPKDWRVWSGLTYPGSSLPNAMVQVGPITEFGSGAGYEYEDTEILGFAMTNKGHWNLCNLPILPLPEDAEYPYKSKFSHQKEKASPAYYEVFLEDYGIKTRVTSTLRAAIQEYTFNESGGQRILFDLGKANSKIHDWGISLKEGTLEGFQNMGRETIYFSARFNTRLNGLEIIKKGDQEGYSIVSLEAKMEEPVVLKIGVSFVSIQNAAENLEKEIGDKTFDRIHREGEDIWNTLLSRIEVKGGTDKEKGLFYSSLYRSFLWPALRSDINGEYTDIKGETRKGDFGYYTVPSLWDTYRNKLVLLALLRPKVTNDVIESLIDIGELTGYVPTFFHGDHGASFIAGSYFRGVDNFDINKAYQLLLNNAYRENKGHNGGRPYLKPYIEKGFIPEFRINNPVVGTVGSAGVSKTLEYAYDDHALSLLAKELNDSIHFDDLSKRAKNYKNVFDTTTHFMRGRFANGDWVSPFNPQYPYYEYMYREANAWQVSFYVPHDMPGLVGIYGGKDAFEQKLDSLFTLPWNPDHIARNVSGFIGQYCHGNQPDHEAPFSYYFVDKPEKSQVVIDKILGGFYGMGKDGLALSGMDDAGEMSSWYVCAAMGLYPLSPADSEYLVSVPLFEEVKWNLENGNTLIIKNPTRGRKLKGIMLNGNKNSGYFVSNEIFNKGGEILLDTE